MMNTKIVSLFLGFLLFLVPNAWSATYYVAKAGSGGSDANSCATAQTHTSGKLTVLAGVACMSPGDTLFIKAGTYSEAFSSSTAWPSGSGSSWTTATRISAYLTGSTYDVVTLDNSGTARVLHLNSSSKNYIIFEGLIFDGTGGVSSSSDTIKIEGGAHHIRILNSEIKNGLRQGILVSSPASGAQTQFNEFINLNVHTNGFDGVSLNDNLNHGLYIAAPDNLAERCNVHDNRAYGIHVYDGANASAHRNIVRYNRSYSNGRNGILIGSGDGNIAHHNVSYNNEQKGIQVGFEATNNKVYNNTVYGNGTYGIEVRSTATNTIVKNNIFYNTGTAILDSGVTSTLTTNRTTDPSFINAAGADFGLQAGSAAINAGTAISGYAYNGAAPDQGAFETFTCTSVLPDTAGDNTFVITCENNLAPPLLPATGCLGFSAKKNDVANAITNCSRTADNKITLTLTNSYINTDVGKWSYVTASGNVTDSMKIGGTLNQRLNAVTDQIPTNQIGISAPVLTQVSGRFSVGGTEASADRKLQNNTELAVPPKACFNYRVCISNTVASFGVSGYTLRAQKNGAGGYLAISNGPTPTTGISFITGTGRISYLLPGPTTEQLACPDTFVPGGVMLSASEVPNITLATGEGTELIYGLCVGESNADNDYFDLRVYSAGGVPLNTYTQTGRVRVRTTAAFSTQIGAP